MRLVRCDRCGIERPAKPPNRDDEPMHRIVVSGLTGLELLAKTAVYEWDLCSRCVEAVRTAIQDHPQLQVSR